MIGTELPLIAEREPPSGSHVVTARRGYLHHGIYVGAGKVVHYAGLANGLRGGPVEEITLDRFTRGKPAWVRFNAPSNYDSREVVRRARSRVGEDCYRLLTNNCEHFCEWCLHGERRSYQVDAWLGRPRRALRATLGLIAHPFSALRPSGPRAARPALRTAMENVLARLTPRLTLTNLVHRGGSALRVAARMTSDPSDGAFETTAYPADLTLLRDGISAHQTLTGEAT